MKCEKGMTKDTCPYNPRLGCDCGLNPPIRIKRDFCIQCGASFPPRYGEGICKDWEKCREKQEGKFS